MATYNWRNVGTDVGLAIDWNNTTTGDNPALTPPGASDTIQFQTIGGGTLTGAVSVSTANIISATNDSWKVSAQITAGAILVRSPTAITTGGKLTVTGVTGPTNGLSLFAATTVSGGSIDGSAATTTIGNNQSAAPAGGLTVQGGGTVTTLGLSTYAPSTANPASVNIVVDGAGSRLTTMSNPALDTATFTSGYLNIATINLGGSASLVVSNAGAATVSGLFAVGQNGGNGTAQVLTGGSLTAAGAIYVGGGGATPTTPGLGTLTISGGGVVRSTAASDTSRSYLQIANSTAGTGSVTVTGAGSLLDIGNNAASIGVGGTGSLTVAAGAAARSSTADSVTRAALIVGTNSRSSGTVTVTGSKSSYTATGSAFFGRAGTGALIVDSGAVFTGGQAAAGTVAGSSVTIGSGDSSSATSTFYGGSGSAQVKSGALLHSLYNLTVGFDGTVGSLLVDNATALADRFVTIGSGTDRVGGNGTVTLQNGGVLRAGGQHITGLSGIGIGVGPGNSGSVTVTGSGSVLDANGDRLSIGTRPSSGSSLPGTGSGTLTISAGGKALAGSSYADVEAALAVGAATNEVGTLSVIGAGSQLMVSGRAILGGNDIGAGVVAGGTGALSVTGGGRVQAGGVTVLGGSSVALDVASVLDAGGLALAAGATLAAAGGTLLGDVTDGGTLSNAGGALSITGSVTGAGNLQVGAGLLSVGGSIGAETVAFTAPGATLRMHGLTGAATVTGFQAGDSLDLAGVTGATLSTSATGAVVQAGGGSLSLGTAPAGSAYRLYGDGHGGTQVLLDSPPPAAAVAFTGAGGSGLATGDGYTGPVDYLQRQYIWPGAGGVAMSANVPNVFLHGGPADDALQVSGGNNVLDGGAGSNFLVGANGADGGNDTFFVDGRGGNVTWSTLVNFRHGDNFTLFGFVDGVSTRPFTDADGVTGYQGATIHSELGGAGMGVNGSVTFAGISLADAQAKFTVSAGKVGDTPYLNVAYTG